MTSPQGIEKDTREREREKESEKKRKIEIIEREGERETEEYRRRKKERGRGRKVHQDKIECHMSPLTRSYTLALPDPPALIFLWALL